MKYVLILMICLVMFGCDPFDSCPTNPGPDRYDQCKKACDDMDRYVVAFSYDPVKGSVCTCGEFKIKGGK